MHWKSRLAFLVFAAAALALTLAVMIWPSHPLDPLTATGAETVTVLDVSRPFALSSLPRGWRHRSFWFTPPMQVSFVEHQGVPALKCETKGSGSILGRATEIDLASRPLLEWRWFVEVPIVSDRDEATREGDDHPVRLFLEFRDQQNGRHATEIIWGNKRYERGDTKVIGSFVHYVADAGMANIGRWRDESVDLTAIYRKVTGRSDTPRLTFIGVFCDSDNTRSRSVAYTSDVVLRRR